MTAESNSRTYGLISTESSDDQIIFARKGQNVGGCAIGILYLEDLCYPKIPGNVLNAYSYDFPVLFKSVKDVRPEDLDCGALEAFNAIYEAASQLKQEGARAITSACGYFGHYQEMLSNVINVPVCMSALLQVNWIRAVLRTDAKIGILTAVKNSMTEDLMRKSGVHDTRNLIIQGLEDGPCFRSLLDNKEHINNDGVKNEVVLAAKNLVTNNEEIDAILLTCSDIPPYAAAVQAATGLPVFDYISMIRWLHDAVVQRSYNGIL